MQVLKSDITSGEYKSYYEKYLNRVESNTELFQALEEKSELADFFLALPLKKHDFSYADGKWTPKQILQHLLDTERIFSNRALRFSRFDFTELPGYDENHYAEHCFSKQRSITDLVEEFEVLRSSTISLFRSFLPEVYANTGQASGGPLSVRSIPFILTGHQKHHIHIIQERYL